MNRGEPSDDLSKIRGGRSSVVVTLLGLEPRGLLREILSFSSTQGGADTPARITGDGYKNGGEVKSTRRHSGMNVDPSGGDNHSGPGRGGDTSLSCGKPAN